MDVMGSFFCDGVIEFEPRIGVFGITLESITESHGTMKTIEYPVII